MEGDMARTPKPTAAEELASKKREAERLQRVTDFIELAQQHGRIDESPSDLQLQELMRAFEQMEGRAARQALTGTPFDEAFDNEMVSAVTQGIGQFLRTIPGTPEHRMRQEDFERQLQIRQQREAFEAQQRAEQQALEQRAIFERQVAPPEDEAFARFLSGIVDPEVQALAFEQRPQLTEGFQRAVAERDMPLRRMAAERESFLAQPLERRGAVTEEMFGEFQQLRQPEPLDFGTFLQRELGTLEEQTAQQRRQREFERRPVARTIFR
jgi:hypothetical protein